MEEIKELFDFIESSPTNAHAIYNITKKLKSEGFEELRENELWQLKENKKYFITRNMTSLIAFKIPETDFSSFLIVAPHGDSPNFRIKENPEIRVAKKYTKLSTEVYGGTNLNLWFDRPLSVAGRVSVDTQKGIETRLVNIDRDLLIIPSLAIHMNRNINSGEEINPAKDTFPLFSLTDKSLKELIASELDMDEADIIAHDLYVYSRQKPTSFGADNEFIAAPRLDDLECVFTGFRAFIEADENSTKSTQVFCVFDNEEIGSMTRQGADSDFLRNTLNRICKNLKKGYEETQNTIYSSFLLSADNAHALHPNYAEKSDPTNFCFLNGGVVIKHGVRYTTDTISSAVFKKICKKNGIPYQDFFNNAKIPGGSTLGNISASQISIPTLDIGLPQLAMHSPYESAGSKDVSYMIAAIKSFYESCIRPKKDGVYDIG